MAVQPYKIPKNQQIVHLQWMNFMECKLHLNKATFKT